MVHTNLLNVVKLVISTMCVTIAKVAIWVLTKLCIRNLMESGATNYLNTKLICSHSPLQVLGTTYPHSQSLTPNISLPGK